MWITGDVIGPLVIPLANTGCNYDLIGSLAPTAASLTGLARTVQPSRLCVSERGGVRLGRPRNRRRIPGEAWINGAIDTHVLGHEAGAQSRPLPLPRAQCGTVAIGGSCTNDEYGDRFDTMGLGTPTTSTPCRRISSAGSATGLAADHRRAVERYLHARPLRNAGDQSKALRYRRRRGLVVCRVPDADGVRSRVASYPNVTSGVLVHYWNGDGNGVYLLDMTPATSSWQDPR
jgi:hypothetical protein